jgi:hypothetical protein
VPYEKLVKLAREHIDSENMIDGIDLSHSKNMSVERAEAFLSTYLALTLA